MLVEFCDNFSLFLSLDQVGDEIRHLKGNDPITKVSPIDEMEILMPGEIHRS